MNFCAIWWIVPSKSLRRLILIKSFYGTHCVGSEKIISGPGSDFEGNSGSEFTHIFPIADPGQNLTFFSKSKQKTFEII